MSRALLPHMRIPFCLIVCCAVSVSSCDRERKKTPEELLDADIALASDLARANDALGEGEPDTLIGLTDDDPPLPGIEAEVPDSGPRRSLAEPRANAPAPAPVRPRVVAEPANETPRPPVSGPGCSSPATADQRRCLLSQLAQYDVGLNGAYRELIQRLRSEAGAGAGDPDPASVERLRAAQRSWLVYRDRECRRRTRSREGELWAPVRASCLGDLSDARARELRAM